jgi:DNA replication and repair protein RecF
LPVDALNSWDESVAKWGVQVCRARHAFIREFSVRVADVHARVAGGAEIMSLEYKPSFAGPWNDEDVERWVNKLRASRPQEMAAGITLTGPQRDDLQFLLNGRPAREFASEGQKRTCAVAFKLAEIPTIQERVGQKPICLLDDVLSELDVHRAEHLLDELSETGQCFVTLTGLESWPAHRDLPASIFNVDKTGVRRDGGQPRAFVPMAAHPN